ncbi:MAG: hypothetical protein HKM93_13020 [Desulfobacteraceae bacterium]|nr:hypothetical protein [Desulfobacteraceae bacterium]
MKDSREDRLYELLPPIYRIRDTEQGEPLKALLRVIGEQVNLVEDDIRQLYENWFIETCEEWVVPYISALIGYEPVHEAGEPSHVDSPQGRRRNRFLLPRREVANTIRYRRRKGTLALLELLSNDVAGWPARAVEFYTLLGWTQSLNHLQLNRAATVDLHNNSRLDRIDGPFDRSAHTIDVHRINSAHTLGRHNIPSVGVFVWRLKSYSVSETSAYYHEPVSSKAGSHCYTFSVLGNDAPLYMLPAPETDPTHIADELNLPVPIGRRLLEEHKDLIYGPEKSLQIWTGVKKGDVVIRKPVSADQIVPADLSDWRYAPGKNTVAVDPALGRIAFPKRQWPDDGVWVRYHYGFGMDLGGGEYERTLSQPEGCRIYHVRKNGNDVFNTIVAALDAWHKDSDDQPVEHAVIEIMDSGVYVERLNIIFEEGQRSLQLRAANRKRPVVLLLDWQPGQPDPLSVTGADGSRFTLDGILIAGRSMQVEGDLAALTIRHSTLVPGWQLGGDCTPRRASGSSLEIFSPKICVKIEHSILGSILVDPVIQAPIEEPSDPKQERPSAEEVKQARCQGIGREFRLGPIPICINDSIIDATNPKIEALGAPGCPVAHAVLTIVRSTVFGRVQVHAIELGENSIFDGRITVARRQKGCIRFSYVTPESRTPRRYHCQPELAVDNTKKNMLQNSEEDPPTEPTDEQLKNAQRLVEKRVRPWFRSVRFGQPAYCQLSGYTPEEIVRGADDESEMGVFHQLYQPQRAANLRVRLDEYLPAKMDVGIIFSN